MALNFDIPDFSTLSKRSINLKLSHLAQTLTPGSHVIVDSTGLKVYGKSEWQQEKHDENAKRTWRKLHIAVDEKLQIIAYDITFNSIGDTTGAFDLLAQVEHDFKVFMGKGAYDSFTLNEAILTNQPDAKTVIPPPSVAVFSQEGNTQRDNHIRLLDGLGRMAWQKQNNYGLRSHIELAILRYKKVIGPAMKARDYLSKKKKAGLVRVL